MIFGNLDRAVFLLAIGTALGSSIGTARADDDAVPPKLAPFEALIGGWNGTGQPVANRIRGWRERHVWAWKFAKGKPVAVTLKWEGNKLLTAGAIAADPESGGYRLDGTDADGQPVAYAGQFDESGRQLVLKPTAELAGDPQMTIRIHENGIRYTIWIDRKENGAPRARREIEVGVTRDGEAFAAGGGGSGASGPKCIITGGTATMSVTYQGKTYPLCCTGCRDEFNENPEKYVAKSAAAKTGGGGKPAPAPETTPTPEQPGPSETKKAPASPEGPKAAGKPATKPAATSAAAWLRLGQALEKVGKKSSALEYYKRILREAPDAPEAATAAEKVKALEGK